MNENSASVKKWDKIKIIAESLLVLIFVCFPFLHVTTGLDLSDTGYGLSNFQNFPDINMTWAISTGLSLAIGKLFTYMPFGNSIIGMYAYCMALSSGMVLVIYFILRKLLIRLFPKAPVFLMTGIGFMIAVGYSWAPRTCIYQYMSYYLFDIAALLILSALIMDSEKVSLVKLALAGIILAAAAFVRFPNVIDVGLILVVFAFGLYKKQNILKPFLTCFFSYVFMFAAGFLVVEMVWGKGSYIAMINGLSGMTGDAKDYKPLSMITSSLEHYIYFSKYLLIIIGYTVVSFVIYGYLKTKKSRVIFAIMQIPAFCVLSIVLLKINAFNFWYYEYSSIMAWGVFMLDIAISLCVISFISKKTSIEKKLFSLTVLLAIMLTPLGSNQGVYPILNNLFLVTPYILLMLSDGVTLRVFDNREENGFRWDLLPVRIMCFLIMMAALMQGTLFGLDFIFREQPFLTGQFATVNDNKVLKGIRTEKGRAADIDELSRFIYDNGFEGKTAIFYGNVPMLSYALNMPCAISHCWPDLDSYTSEELRSDIEGIKERPLIIYFSQDKDFFYGDKANITTEKEQMIMSLIEAENYTVIFKNSRFTVMF